MGKGNTGGHIAAPIFGSFMKMALADTPATPFRVAPGIKLVRVNLRTGLRASPDDPQAIVEAFKPNEEPDDAYSVIGFSDPAASASGPEEAAQGGWQPAPPGGPGYGGGRGGMW
jgi:penicillin-binding protein 1A